MGLLGRFRRKEKKKVAEETAKVITDLAQICEDDKETYEALVDTMFLDPRKIKTSMKDAVENAKKFEKAKEFRQARLWYEIAGGLAIYEGNVKKVVELFSECERNAPGKKYLILKNPEKAVAKAQEYYAKYLKD